MKVKIIRATWSAEQGAILELRFDDGTGGQAIMPMRKEPYTKEDVVAAIQQHRESMVVPNKVFDVLQNWHDWVEIPEPQ